METTASTGVASEVGSFAKMIGDNGMMICVCAVVLMGLAGTMVIGLKYWNRRVGGEYIKKSEIKDYLKENHPELLITSADDLPKLSEHSFFATCTTGIRSAESMRIGTSVVKTDLAKDLLTWSFRAYRNVFAGLVEAIYEHKNGFDAAAGNRQRVQALISEHLSIVNGGIRSKLVGELEYPVAVYDAWYNEQRERDRALVDVIELVIAQNPQAYWQISNTLTALYFKALTMEDEVIHFFENFTVEGVAYESLPENRESTYSSMNARSMEGYNPKHSASLEKGWKSKL